MEKETADEMEVAAEAFEKREEEKEVEEEQIVLILFGLVIIVGWLNKSGSRQYWLR